MSVNTVVLESKLAETFGFEHVVMLGRARSGLVALLELFREGSDQPIPVLLPENICPILVTAIRAGGGIAVTIPVSPLTGLPEDQEFVHAMKNSSKCGIVMPVHLYGFLGEYPETVKYARKKGWFILENDTNVVRSQSQEKAFGDALLVSFGYAKPLEVGRGGALLTNDPLLAQRLRQHVGTYRVLDKKALAMEEQIMLKRRAIRGRLVTNSDELIQICSEEVNLAKFDFDPKDTDKILVKISSFPQENEKRLECRDLWEHALAGMEDIFQPIPLKQPVPWRVIRRIPRQRDHFAQALWAQKIDAGINYRSLWREMPSSYLSGDNSVRDKWGDEVLNLWVTEDYNKLKIKNAGEILMEVANEIRR